MSDATRPGPSLATRPDPVPAGQPDPMAAGQPDPVPAGPVPVAPASPVLIAQPDRLTRFFDRVATGSPVWLAPAALAGCMAGATGYTLLVDPADVGAGDLPTCLVKYTTGFVCPGCGGTRAFWFLLHADLSSAARHHAMFVFAVPFLLYVYLAWAGRRLFSWRLPQLRIGPRAIGSFLGAWGLFTVLRNLPWEPFTRFFV